jgi:hypothetical protein
MKAEKGNIVVSFLILVGFVFIVILALTMLSGQGDPSISKLWFTAISQ